MKKKHISSTIKTLSDQLIKNWPLYSFVTSNPLAGFEHLPFEDALKQIRQNLGIRGYPSAAHLKQMWTRNKVDAAIIEQKLKKQDFDVTPEESLDLLSSLEKHQTAEQLLGTIDRQTIKWISVFLDQGSTEWSLPNRADGFFKAWREIAPFDPRLPHREYIEYLPAEPGHALQELLSSHAPDELEYIFKHHLYALPGWTGYILNRMEHKNAWQQRYPITLTDYLAVRLTLCTLFDEPFLPKNAKDDRNDEYEDQLKLTWLEALEQSYQATLIPKLLNHSKDDNTENKQSPEAQFVLCIDTRSERIRRAIEQSGPYQTFGYAGFFGVAMDYHHPEKEITHKACPPIVESAFQASEQIQPQRRDQAERFNFYTTLQNALNEFRFTLKNNIPGSFGYVESAGLFYGIGMLTKTLMPDFVYRLTDKMSEFIGSPDNFSKVELSDQNGKAGSTKKRLTTNQKAEIAKTAFDLMGWDAFARLVIFAGHGSQTANNPFGSSLDCGACSGNKGRHNARVLADICNESEVRRLLAKEHGIHIPDETLFVAAEHNTTTNHIELFDAALPAGYEKQIQKLKKNLKDARDAANAEQFRFSAQVSAKNRENEAHRRAADWAETRPEWGLAGNASFIIGKRALTSHLNLEARSFLHDYDWEKDPNGDQLEAIFKGPMVVTQWINNHYYFATVDNEHFGSGTKTTQNVTGTYGVVQGNGGDLQYGLPLESIQEDDHRLQHIPVRLTVLVQAPKSRVTEIISEHPDSLGRLIENQWIYLAVLDPMEDHNVTFVDPDHSKKLSFNTYKSSVGSFIGKDI